MLHNVKYEKCIKSSRAISINLRSLYINTDSANLCFIFQQKLCLLF